MIIDATKIKYYADYPISDSYIEKTIIRKEKKNSSRKKTSQKHLKH